MTSPRLKSGKGKRTPKILTKKNQSAPVEPAVDGLWQGNPKVLQIPRRMEVTCLGYNRKEKCRNSVPWGTPPLSCPTPEVGSHLRNPQHPSRRGVKKTLWSSSFETNLISYLLPAWSCRFRWKILVIRQQGGIGLCGIKVTPGLQRWSLWNDFLSVLQRVLRACMMFVSRLA